MVVPESVPVVPLEAPVVEPARVLPVEVAPRNVAPVELAPWDVEPVEVAIAPCAVPDEVVLPVEAPVPAEPELRPPIAPAEVDSPTI